MLSGSYLYFYKDSKQTMPATYYYLRGVIIEENNAELQLGHNLYIQGRYGTCCLAFVTE
jgi:hypothetical protein